MPRLTVDLSHDDYQQIQAFAKGLRSASSPLVQGAMTIEALAGTLLRKGLEVERVAWYRGQAAHTGYIPSEHPQDILRDVLAYLEDEATPEQLNGLVARVRRAVLQREVPRLNPMALETLAALCSEQRE